MEKRQNEQQHYDAGWNSKRSKNDVNKKQNEVFKVLPTERFCSKFPYFRKPLEIGAFSLNAERKFHKDRSELKHYIEPQNCKRVNFDLRIGYKSMIRKNDEIKEYLDDLLRWISLSKDKFVLPNAKMEEKTRSSLQEPSSSLRQLNTDFVSWRGLLTKLLCTPFESRDGWMVAVCLYNGTYYMCEYDTEARKLQKQNTTERLDEMSCWGWKFEQYLTADKPGGIPDTKPPVNNNEAFCTVVRSRLNSHSLVYGGEVDALLPDFSSGNKYVEFKTTRDIENERQDQNFRRFKLIKWWAQSFLVGIEKIVAGYRDDDGVVHRLETLETMRIPETVKHIRYHWNPAVCFNFVDQFLSFVKKTVIEDNPKIVYVFEWEPNGDVRWRETRDSAFHFLPDWYINEQQNMMNIQRVSEQQLNPPVGDTTDR
ncbi:hypothetical protein ScPMuIL_003545 [Solemya velum]